MIYRNHKSGNPRCKVTVAPSRNFTLFDILLALLALGFWLFVSWNTAGAQVIVPTPVCVTIEPDAVGCLVPPVTWVAPTATVVVPPTVSPFEPTPTPDATPTLVATSTGPTEPTVTPAPTLRPVSRCLVLACLYVPLAVRP